jgi:hypothetical protein
MRDTAIHGTDDRARIVSSVRETPVDAEQCGRWNGFGVFRSSIMQLRLGWRLIGQSVGRRKALSMMVVAD